MTLLLLLLSSMWMRVNPTLAQDYISTERQSPLTHDSVPSSYLLTHWIYLFQTFVICPEEGAGETDINAGLSGINSEVFQLLNGSICVHSRSFAAIIVIQEVISMSSTVMLERELPAVAGGNPAKQTPFGRAKRYGA